MNVLLLRPYKIEIDATNMQRLGLFMQGGIGVNVRTTGSRGISDIYIYI